MGKGVTPEALWPKHHAHDVKGLPLIRTLCRRLVVPHDCRHLALLVAEFHQQVHKAFELKAKNGIEAVQQEQMLGVSQHGLKRYSVHVKQTVEAVQGLNRLSIRSNPMVHFARYGS